MSDCLTKQLPFFNNCTFLSFKYLYLKGAAFKAIKRPDQGVIIVLLRRGFSKICLYWVLKLITTQSTALHIIMHSSMTCLFTPLLSLFHSASRRVSGIQQLNEWTDILTHELHSSSLSDNNSFESKTHKRDFLKTNIDMAKVYQMYTVEFC